MLSVPTRLSAVLGFSKPENRMFAVPWDPDERIVNQFVSLLTALHVQAHAPRVAENMVVLEAEHYPREKICAGGLGARAFSILDKIDVAVDCPMVAIDAVAMRVGDTEMITRVPGCGVVVRRFEFDHALAKQARARGIDLREGATVVAIEEHAEITRLGAVDEHRSRQGMDDIEVGTMQVGGRHLRSHRPVEGIPGFQDHRVAWVDSEDGGDVGMPTIVSGVGFIPQRFAAVDADGVACGSHGDLLCAWGCAAAA